MPNFETAQQRLQAIHRAITLINKLLQAYSICLELSSALELYQAGTDAAFNAAIDSSFDAAERDQLAQMLTQADSLTVNWSANHAELLGINGT